MDKRPKTIFCDIDGTLVKHSIPSQASLPSHKMELLPGTIEKLSEWDSLGYTIILVTGRKESLRSVTEKQLSEVGIFYDKLIMGIGSGERILINDKKPNGTITAHSINLKRNHGLTEIKI
jgi:hydroxymethylpyrimidine pyrophosphatase-like HAD family hydrolase